MRIKRVDEFIDLEFKKQNLIKESRIRESRMSFDGLYEYINSLGDFRELAINFLSSEDDIKYIKRDYNDIKSKEDYWMFKNHNEYKSFIDGFFKFIEGDEYLSDSWSFFEKNGFMFQINSDDYNISFLKSYKFKNIKKIINELTYVINKFIEYSSDRLNIKKRLIFYRTDDLAKNKILVFNDSTKDIGINRLITIIELEKIK